MQCQAFLIRLGNASKNYLFDDYTIIGYNYRVQRFKCGTRFL